MRARNLLAILAMMWASSSVWAVCPMQEATVLFMNGVWTSQEDALKHKDLLEREVYARGVSSDCVHFELSHTQPDSTGDIMEAIIQKSIELDVPLLSIVRIIYLVTILSTTQNPFLALAFDQVLTAVYAIPIAVVEAQTEKHVNKLKTLALNKNHRGIMVTHSQGGLYANAVWDRLTPVQQTNTRIVSVVTPAASVAGGGPNTRLSRDAVANLFFLAALQEEKIDNTGRLCDREAEEEENSWPCHGFQAGYLHDPETKQKIVDDIVALLPEEPESASGDFCRGADGGTYSTFGGTFFHRAGWRYTSTVSASVAQITTSLIRVGSPEIPGSQYRSKVYRGGTDSAPDSGVLLATSPWYDISVLSASSFTIRNIGLPFSMVRGETYYFLFETDVDWDLDWQVGLETCSELGGVDRTFGIREYPSPGNWQTGGSVYASWSSSPSGVARSFSSATPWGESHFHSPAQTRILNTPGDISSIGVWMHRDGAASGLMYMRLYDASYTLLGTSNAQVVEDLPDIDFEFGDISDNGLEFITFTFSPALTVTSTFYIKPARTITPPVLS